MLIRRFDDGNRMDGNIIMVTTIGNPIIVGVMNEANKFSFILILKGYLLFVLLVFLVMVIVGKLVKKFSTEIKQIE